MLTLTLTQQACDPMAAVEEQHQSKPIHQIQIEYNSPWCRKTQNPWCRNKSGAERADVHRNQTDQTTESMVQEHESMAERAADRNQTDQTTIPMPVVHPPHTLPGLIRQSPTRTQYACSVAMTSSVQWQSSWLADMHIPSMPTALRCNLRWKW